MADKYNFEKVYEKLQNDSADELEELWLKAKKENKKRNIISIVLSLIIDIVIVTFYIKQFQAGEEAITFNFPAPIAMILITALISNILIFVIISIIINKERKIYNVAFKKLIINGLISNFYDNTKCLPTEGISRNIYNEAKYNEYYNRYYSEDYMEGKIDNKYEIKMAEVKTQQVEQQRDSDGHTTTTTDTIFHGLFAKIQINKSINNELMIKQNNSFRFKKNKLEMDSQEFEKLFDVSSNNKIIGMQLLTSDIMEKLVNFYNKTRIKYDICIYNSDIYLRFKCGPVFEIPRLKNGALNIKTLKRYYDILEFTYSLISELIKLINETQI